MRQIGTKIKVKNPEMKLLIDVANELFADGKVSSFRDFSRKYLDKTSNYMNILFYNETKKPSIPALLGLHRKLTNEVNNNFVSKIKKEPAGLAGGSSYTPIRLTLPAHA